MKMKYWKPLMRVYLFFAITCFILAVFVAIGIIEARHPTFCALIFTLLGVAAMLVRRKAIEVFKGFELSLAQNEAILELSQKINNNIKNQ